MGNDNLAESTKWTGIGLILLGVLIMSLWLVLRFIVAWSRLGSASKREILAVILIGALITILGIYLRVYPDKCALEREKKSREDTQTQFDQRLRDVEDKYSNQRELLQIAISNHVTLAKQLKLVTHISKAMTRNWLKDRSGK
jgi:hypothetical protein